VSSVASDTVLARFAAESLTHRSSCQNWQNA